MRLSIGTKLVLGFLPALFALLLAGWVFYDRLQDLDDNSRWVSHTLEVLTELENTQSQFSEAKSSAAAYQLTLNDRFQQAFEAAVAQTDVSIAHLRQLTADNPAQQERLTSLQAALRTRFEFLEQAMERARQQGQGFSPGNIDPLGPALAQPVIEAMQKAERQLLIERRAVLGASVDRSVQLVLAVAGASIVLVLLFGAGTLRSITGPLLTLQASARRVGGGDYSHRLDVQSDDEIGQVARVFNQMVTQIQEREAAAAEQDWIKSSLAGMGVIYQTERDLSAACRTTLSRLAELLQAPYLVLYLSNDKDEAPGLKRCGAFAAPHAPDHVAPGEGLVGQCLLEGRRLTVQGLPPDYVRIQSALGSAVPTELVVAPIRYDSGVQAVLEIGLLRPLTGAEQEFLDRLADDLGLMLTSFRAKEATEISLRRQTALAEALERQRQDLARSNHELEEQSEQLRASEALAREQQEELKVANEEQQQANDELRELTQNLDLKNQQLSEVSTFKSEFLANMSHELRTPLNSLLILSKLLTEDQEHPLSPKQQQYARTIHESGNDLLRQINEVLDMARIESGKMQIDVKAAPLSEIVRRAEDTFRHVAQSRQLAFDIQLGDGLPALLLTDENRLWQILKNLLSNAFKFTSQGGVTLRIDAEAGDEAHAGFLRFAVSDTGIGIPQDKQQQIFEAFQQADSGISRHYGGTGLGLSISLNLAHLLGGNLTVDSEEGRGSRFTLVLPAEGASGAFRADDAPFAGTTTTTATTTAAAGDGAAAPRTALAASPTPLPVPSASPAPPAGPLLVVSRRENVLVALRELARLQQAGFESLDDFAPLVATCVQLQPTLVVLDAELDSPGLWTTLGHVKEDARTRHTAVHLLCHPSQKARALRLGVASYTLLPLESTEMLISTVAPRLERLMQPLRNVLVVEDDATQRQAILDLIGNNDIHARGVGTAAETLQAVESSIIDCIVLDLGLPDMDGTQLVGELNRRLGLRCPPVLVYTARDIGQSEELELMKGAQALIVKGANSPERLIDEMTLLLSRWPSKLSAATRQLIDRSRQHDPVLAGRKVLVVDDDVRNIFSISAALESHGMAVIHAESGQAGIDMLQQHPDTEAVLMDVMMPGMDGLETTRRIRQMPALADLPVIAVTAKAMPGDREMCLQAGASDYLSKPVDMDRLRAMIRAWLAR